MRKVDLNGKGMRLSGVYRSEWRVPLSSLSSEEGHFGAQWGLNGYGDTLE